MTDAKDVSAKLLGNVRHLLESGVETVEILTGVRDAFNKKPRLTAKERGDITAALNGVIDHLRRTVNQVPYEPATKALEAKVVELTALVEQQASYIHNNIKPAVKPTEALFLAKEQPDSVFGIYAVNEEWLSHKVSTTKTITEDLLKRLIETEAAMMGHRQLGHSNFQVVVVLGGNKRARFSLRQGSQVNGLQRLFGINPQHPQNAMLDFGTLLGHVNRGPHPY